MATPTREIGGTGLEQFSGFINHDFLKDWRGAKKFKNVREMLLNSPVVGALMTAIEHSVRSVEWQWTSDLSDEEAGIEDPRLEIINDSINSMSHSWADHVIEALSFLPYGFAPFEIVYRRVNGRVLWRKFAIRGQDTIYKWDLDPSGGIQGFTQQLTTGMKIGTFFIPIEKLILYRSRLDRNNPEGRSILRNAYTSYYYGKNIQQVEAIGIERDLAGLPVMRLPQNADPAGDDGTKAAEIVRRVRNDEQAGLVLPHGWEFELASTNGRRLFDTDSIISRYDKRILTTVLAQFLILGQDKVGALSLSQDQTDFFNMSVNTVADIIAETITKFAIPRLMKLNGLDADGLRLEHSPAGDINLELLANALQAVGSKITWTVDDEVWLRSAFGLPRIEPDVIQEEREKAQENMPAFQPGFSLQKYAADTAPDDEEREKMERKWTSRWKRFLKEQQQRVINAVKGV